MDNANEEVKKTAEIFEAVEVEERKQPEINEAMPKMEKLNSEEENIDEEVETKKGAEKRRAKHKEKLEKMTEEERLEYRKKVRRRKARMEEKAEEPESTDGVVNAEETKKSSIFAKPLVFKKPVEESELVHEDKAIEEKAFEEKESLMDEAPFLIDEFLEKDETEPLHLRELEGNELKEFATVVKEVMWSGLGNPVAAMKQAEESKYRTEFIFGGVFLLLMFITTSIHIPVLQSVFGVMGRMQIALIAVILVAIIIISMASVLYVFAKKKRENIRIKSIFGAFSISLIPGIITVLLSFVLGYLSVVGVALVLAVSFIYWLLLSSQICTYYLKKDVFMSNIVMVLSSIIIFFVVYFAIKLTVLQALTMMINTSAEAVQAADGTIVGSAEVIVEKVIQFLRDVDTLLGN